MPKNPCVPMFENSIYGGQNLDSVILYQIFGEWSDKHCQLARSCWELGRAQAYLRTPMLAVSGADDDGPEPKSHASDNTKHIETQLLGRS